MTFISRVGRRLRRGVRRRTDNRSRSSIPTGEDMDRLRTERRHARIHQLMDSEAIEIRIRAVRIAGEFLDREPEPKMLSALAAAAGGAQSEVLTASSTDLTARMNPGELRQIVDAAGRVPYPGAKSDLLAMVAGERRRWLQQRCMLAALQFCPVTEAGICQALARLESEQIPLVSGPVPVSSLHPDTGRRATMEWILRSLFPSHGQSWWSRTAGRWIEDPLNGPMVREDRGADAIQASAIRRRLKAAPNHPDRLAEIRHLGQIGRDRDFGTLVDCLTNAATPDFRMAATEALGRHGDPRALPILLSHLEQGGPGAPSAAEALGRLGMFAASGHLIHKLMPLDALPNWGQASQDDPLRLERSILWALGELGAPEAARAVAGRLDAGGTSTHSAPLAAWAMDALSKMGPEGANAALARTGHSASSDITSRHAEGVAAMLDAHNAPVSG